MQRSSVRHFTSILHSFLLDNFITAVAVGAKLIDTALIDVFPSGELLDVFLTPGLLRERGLPGRLMTFIPLSTLARTPNLHTIVHAYASFRV